MGLIVGFFIGLVIGILLFYYVIRLQKEHQFSEKYTGYLHRIAQQKDEIDYRQAHLNKYRFLEYNLSEVLVVQHQIVLP